MTNKIWWLCPTTTTLSWVERKMIWHILVEAPITQFLCRQGRQEWPFLIFLTKKWNILSWDPLPRCSPPKKYSAAVLTNFWTGRSSSKRDGRFLWAYMTLGMAVQWWKSCKCQLLIESAVIFALVEVTMLVHCGAIAPLMPSSTPNWRLTSWLFSRVKWSMGRGQCWTAIGLT